jgi:hypothetical protein
MAVNGKYYAWEDITIKLAGETLADIESISWGRKMPIKRRYGKGRTTRGFIRKNIETTGKAKLALEEWQHLQLQPFFQEKGIENHAPFEIVASFDNGEKISTYTLKDCVIIGDNYDGIEQDTDGAMVELDIEILGDIEFE